MRRLLIVLAVAVASLPVAAASAQAVPPPGIHKSIVPANIHKT